MKDRELIRFVRDTRDGVVKVVESRFNAILARLGDAPYQQEGDPKLTTVHLSVEAFSLIWDGLTHTVPMYFHQSSVHARAHRLGWPLDLTERVLLLECYDRRPGVELITGRAIEATVRHCLALNERGLHGDRWNVTLNTPIERIDSVEVEVEVGGPVS